MNRSKSEQRTAWLILLLLIVIVIAATLFLSKGYREYIRDYDEFQEYKAYKQSLEEGKVPDFEWSGKEGEELLEQPHISSNAPTISDNQATVSENGQTQAGNEENINPNPVGEVLTGSKEITDVSGNILWQANMVTEEEASLIRGYVQEREEAYTWTNSYAKTMKINELDKKILETAACKFPNVKVNFVGDSITEGVGGAVDANGKTISYVNYVQEALQFGTVVNNGKAGRMVAAYSINTDLAMQKNSEGLFTKDAEITVFYVGLNDFLAPEETKNFGIIDNGTTGGYCGQLQNWIHSFPKNYPNTEFFFVTAYNVTATNPTTKNTNFDGVPNLNDYMEPQRKLAAQHDYPVIELYSTGFMDMNDAETASHLMSDSLHPNDAGYRVLGEHIAAEIVLYYLGLNS